ncbi:hypothetical protein SO802_021924 [Lithocarpus litseifolius]|uniref:Uncharacterized protein n=1 Tax=Lithocarpus litseifolius TaxID=425828 RepID=A0AAW2CGK8_9ROSI
MRRRRRKQLHCGFAGGIQALRAHVADLLILPKCNTIVALLAAFTLGTTQKGSSQLTLTPQRGRRGNEGSLTEPAHSDTSTGKKRKGGFLDKATDAILKS